MTSIEQEATSGKADPIITPLEIAAHEWLEKHEKLSWWTKHANKDVHAMLAAFHRHMLSKAESAEPVAVEIEEAMRAFWEDGFALCRDYADNYAHWSGLQKERSWVRAKERLSAFLSAPKSASPAASGQGVDVDHPERICERCGNPNVWAWHAPSPLWNAVIRDPVTGNDAFSIICPQCFAHLTEKKFNNDMLIWCFKPHNLPLPADPRGRQWDEENCMWLEGSPPASSSTTNTPKPDGQ